MQTKWPNTSIKWCSNFFIKGGKSPWKPNDWRALQIKFTRGNKIIQYYLVCFYVLNEIFFRKFVDMLWPKIFMDQKFFNPLTLTWILSALLRALPNKVYILSQKRLRKAPYFVKWHFMFLIWTCLSYDSFQSVFRHFGLTFWQYFLAVLMITFKNGIRHEWSWSNYIRSTGF